MPKKNMKCKKILYLGLDPSRFVHESELVHFPLIQIQPRPFVNEVKEAFAKLETYTHILFTSRTPVSLFFEYASQAGFSKELLVKKEYICVGKATAKRLKDFCLKEPMVASIETQEGVILLLQNLKLDRAHIFFPHSANAREALFSYFKTSAVKFSSVALYETLPCQKELPDLNGFDEIVFTSPSTVHAFCLLAKTLPPLNKCIAIGPITEKVLKEQFCQRKIPSQILSPLIF